MCCQPPGLKSGDSQARACGLVCEAMVTDQHSASKAIMTSSIHAQTDHDPIMFFRWLSGLDHFSAIALHERIVHECSTEKGKSLVQVSASWKNFCEFVRLVGNYPTSWELYD